MVTLDNNPEHFKHCTGRGQSHFLQIELGTAEHYLVQTFFLILGSVNFSYHVKINVEKKTKKTSLTVDCLTNYVKCYFV